MSLERELEAAAGAARAHPASAGPVAAVMAAQPGRSDRVYLIALGEGDDHAYVALDGSLAPIADQSKPAAVGPSQANTASSVSGTNNGPPGATGQTMPSTISGEAC